MRDTSGSRERILASIRAALPGASDHANRAAERGHSSIPRLYDRAGTLDAEARVQLLIDRLVDYDTQIVEVAGEEELPGAIAGILNQAGEDRVVVPAEFPREWLPDGFEFGFDGEVSVGEIEQAQAVVTPCEVAVASTGTIFLVHGARQGRRVLTLLPDHHICLVGRGQVVELVAEAIAAVVPLSGLPITTISGPSATADIEMTRIRGVHGPRQLSVVLFG